MGVWAEYLYLRIYGKDGSAKLRVAELEKKLFQENSLAKSRVDSPPSVVPDSVLLESIFDRNEGSYVRPPYFRGLSCIPIRWPAKAIDHSMVG